MSPSNYHELCNIIDNRALSPLYQPIVHLSEQKITGFEALIRGPSASPMHAPIPLFETANRYNKLEQLESLSREISITQFGNLDLPGKLFLNMSPTILLQANKSIKQTLEVLQKSDIKPHNIVIEISEQYPLDDYEVIKNSIEYCKSIGFQIAIDDLGAGYAGLRSWSELQPDYVKIDRHFIARIDEDSVKQEFVHSILDISHGLGCLVIAEGIETKQEYQTVHGMGISLGQGYYLGRPLTFPPTQIDSSLFDPYDYNGFKRFRPSESVANLAMQVPTATANTTVETVAEIFRVTETLHSIPVLDNRKPIGLVYRNDIIELYASRFGRDLHGRKSVTLFMRNNSLMVDHELPVETVSQKLTTAPQLDVSHDFIITKEDNFFGMGHVRDLLRKITELQIRNARYSNPLTQLPGNVPLYELIDRLLNEKTEFYVAYCDLDNFKPYNDVYSYSHGDMVLKKLSTILSTNIDHKTDFVGHIGGDDFILILRSNDWKKRCHIILDTFENDIAALYNEADRVAGGIFAKDRRGLDVFYPLLSLSIGVTCPSYERCQSHHEVSSLATDAKRNAKKIDGNSLFISRRRGPD